jgi:hypothetical protein
MDSTITKPVNPLSSFMRQPKIFIRLPSQGEYWPAGSLAITETGELPVYSMTAKDEMMLKIPDALMNGQAVVDVIEHCVPSIKNAWHIPAIDMDIILIAIRLATYGEKMTTPLEFGDVAMDYQVDLRTIMDTLMNQIGWDPVVSVNDQLTVFVRPLNYKQITATALQTFETQRIMQIANNETMTEDDKLKMFKESFNRLTDSTIGMIGASIYRVDTIAGSTEDPDYIKEFVDNMDKDMFNKIQDHLETLREQNTVKPIHVPVSEDMKAQGITGETVEIPLVFDASTFFV